MVDTVSHGTFLNDNQLHNVTIFHDPALLEFEYVVDGAPRIEESYASGLIPGFGANGVYFGGVPPNAILLSLANSSFAGCLEGVEYDSGAISGPQDPNASPSPVQPEDVGGTVRNGCRDPCDAANCGPGVCVSRWPDRAFCDCRGTNMLGENCIEGEKNYL